ncbi:hypothetical protein [Streptomyces sp. NPDC059533]|uniref:hypothetical protein n=1 Tax=unclassified Streptomyces TaxID=2593676 RepID=UPI003685C02A
MAAAALALTLPATGTATAHTIARTVPQILPMGVAVSSLPVQVEDRTGYQRTGFKHRNAGANPSDGRNTRAEVLIQGAVEAQQIGPGCTLTPAISARSMVARAGGRAGPPASPHWSPWQHRRSCLPSTGRRQ